MGLRNRLEILWNRLLYNMWLIPSIIVVGSAFLAFGAVEASRYLNGLEAWPTIFKGGPESARLILSTIATSIITITGVAFSVMIVALALASSQYSPRVLANFMGDRITQIVLGGLSGIFAFCLVVLLHVGPGTSQEPFVPSFAVLLALVIGIAGIGLFMFFIHHIASSIRATSIITLIQKDTIGVLHEMWTDEPKQPDEPVWDSKNDARWLPVRSPRSGYLQNIELKPLVKYAVRHTLLVRMEKAVGDFVLQGDKLAGYSGGVPALEKALADFCTIDDQRTIENDPVYGIRQIVDVALKALSPGINDVTTAIICIHQLSSILNEAVGRHPDMVDCYADGCLRLIIRPVTLEGLLREAFDEVGQNGKPHPRVLRELITATSRLVAKTKSMTERKTLLDYTQSLAQVVETAPIPDGDRRALLERCEQSLSF